MRTVKMKIFEKKMDNCSSLTSGGALFRASLDTVGVTCFGSTMLFLSLSDVDFCLDLSAKTFKKILHNSFQFIKIQSRSETFAEF